MAKANLYAPCWNNYLNRSLRRRDYAKINRWIDEMCEANGVPELSDKIVWEFNSRFTARMGDATYSCYRIRLSSPLWDRAGEREQEETTKHEAAHLIAGHLYGRNGWGHNGYWQNVMLRGGLSPARTHNVDRKGLTRKRTRHEFECNCRIHWLTTTKANRLARGSHSYYCKTCGENIRRTGRTKEI